jgi:hypothetical protein
MPPYRINSIYKNNLVNIMQSLSYFVNHVNTLFNKTRRCYSMGWRFHKSFKILPGIRLNVGKKGISSVSIGPRGAKLNLGQNGAKLTTGIPGTGISYTTRLDKPVGNRMTECPFCGHRMRKQWDICPQCKRSLIKENPPPESQQGDNGPTIIDTEAHFIDNKPQDLYLLNNKKNKHVGCLTILLIFLLISAISSCMFGGTKKETSSSSLPAVSSVQANTSTSSSKEAEKPQQTTPPPQAEQADTTQQVQQQPTQAAPPQTPNEKKYYGAGPNGEGIKGHIDNKKGAKIYHLPGDPYYSRTTHVAQWFFTEKEAQSAGYRHIYK